MRMVLLFALVLTRFGILFGETSKGSFWSSYKKDTTKRPAVELNSDIHCKQFTLSYLDLMLRERLYKMPVLSANQQLLYKISEIDAFQSEEYKYHFLDTVCTSPNASLIIIAREYVNENIVWLCKFDKNHKLQFTKQVYYDNAEGNFQIETYFDKKILLFKTDDVNEGKRSERYQINKDLNLIRLK